MAIKEKLEDQETVFVDIPLFATTQDAIKDVHIDEKTIIKIQVEEDKNL